MNTDETAYKNRSNIPDQLVKKPLTPWMMK